MFNEEEKHGSIGIYKRRESELKGSRSVEWFIGPN